MQPLPGASMPQGGTVSQSSPITPLASGQINQSGDSITIELVEADETPAAIIVKWPLKASIVHPHRFPASPQPPTSPHAPSPVPPSG